MEQQSIHQLGFKLGREEYGLSLDIVQAVLSYPKLEANEIKDTSGYIQGIFEWTDREILLIDIRKALFTVPVEIDGEKSVVIIETPEFNIGLIVEAVTRAYSLESDQVCRPPRIWPNLEARYLYRLGMIEARLMIMLDIPLLISDIDVQLKGKLRNK